LFVYPEETSIDFKQLNSNRQIIFEDGDFYAVKKEFQKVCEVITTRKQVSSIKKISLNKNTDTICNFIAADYELNKTRLTSIIEGRFINANDIDYKRKNIVLGKEIAYSLFKGNSALEKAVKVDDSYYRIVGVIESVKEGDAAEYDNNCVFIPLSTFGAVYNDNTISNIDIMPFPEEYDSVKKKKNIFLKKRKNISINDNEAISITDTKKDYLKYIELFQSIRYFIWFVSLCMLCLGVLNISNVMTINVNERMKEIGIKKTIGATPMLIITGILIETIILTGFSGIIGMLTGIFIITIVATLMDYFNVINEFFMNPHVDFSIIFIAVMILIFSGIFAGYFPAKYASNIKPIKILRND
jgi:putative ABC transport system permease protein